jgi:5'-methylthioadenosine phosphorylase
VPWQARERVAQGAAVTGSRIGIIGGTGLGEALGTLGRGETHRPETPFGFPSAPIVTTEVAGARVALLARHGEGHRLNPSRVPFRANIFALKLLGVTRILATTAVGSLREEIQPTDLVIPDQVIDKTFLRPNTFFDELAVHVDFAAPFCPSLRRQLLAAGAGGDLRVHEDATYVCIEGPQLSTRAESELHRSWGADLVGMTVMPEAKLAREAEICYALVALPTDYDCWRPSPSELDKLQVLDEIVRNLKRATNNALELVRRALPTVASEGAPTCTCQSSLAMGIWSDRAQIPAAVRQRLAPLLGKYLGEG